MFSTRFIQRVGYPSRYIRKTFLILNNKLKNNPRTFSSNSNFDNKAHPSVLKLEDQKDVDSVTADYKKFLQGIKCNFPSNSDFDNKTHQQKDVDSNTSDYKKFLKETKEYSDNFNNKLKLLEFDKNRKEETMYQIVTHIDEIRKQLQRIPKTKDEENNNTERMQIRCMCALFVCFIVIFLWNAFVYY